MAKVGLLALVIHVLMVGCAWGQSVAPKGKDVPGYDNRTLNPSPDETPVLRVGSGEIQMDAIQNTQENDGVGEGASPVDVIKGQSPTNPNAKEVPGFDPRTVDPNSTKAIGSDPNKGASPIDGKKQPDQTN